LTVAVMMIEIDEDGNGDDSDDGCGDDSDDGDGA
jgi:hypothetical protein